LHAAARLAMSRSIGDAEFKQYGVIAEPNIVSRELSDRVCAPRVTKGLCNGYRFQASSMILSDRDSCAQHAMGNAARFNETH
jgi:hypothetical protein